MEEKQQLLAVPGTRYDGVELRQGHSSRSGSSRSSNKAKAQQQQHQHTEQVSKILELFSGSGAKQEQTETKIV